MHVTRKTNQELVILDSSIWLSVFLLCVSAFVAYRMIVQSNPRGLLLDGLFLIFIVAFWRREVVVFDAGRQQAAWTRRRLFKVATGTIPFSDITGIGMETSSAKNNELVYRLTILTTHGSVPMADNYAGDQQKYQKLREEILGFLNLSPGSAGAPADVAHVSGIDDEASVRSLLAQDRRIDAIQLVRSTQKLSLVEATDRVAAIYEQMHAAK
jgi:hypothetical protein